MRNFVGVSVVAAVVVSAASVGSAQQQVPGVHLCIGPKGFTVVKPNAECPEGETLTRLPALKVRDAKNRQVGDFDTIEAHHYPQVLMRAGETIFVISVRTNRLEGGAWLYYESADCSGTPFFGSGDVTPSVLLPTTAIVNGAETQTVYVPDLTAMQSRLHNSRLSREGICSQTTETKDAYPATVLTTLTFTPPFRVE